MKKLCKRLNNENQAELGYEAYEAYYLGIGFAYEEVEQAYNGNWYLKGYAPLKPLEELKAEKLSEIKQAFNNEQESGYITSSLGFEVDATRRSKDDVESLLYVNVFPVQFRDYNNEFHELTKEQAEVLKREIITYGLSIYQKKWTLEEAIKNVTTIEEVEEVKWVE
ncbi:MAG: DUF4376 domain-containing protein [Alphaproteobacteria bacterium]|nr:DUF4376 domain-containing protein [Alphaproteobacteria bacterium]